MVTVKRNTSEGGANGVTVTTGNSGGSRSGDAWDLVAGGSAVSYITGTGAEGNVATWCNTGGGTANYVYWNITLNEHWGSLFVRHSPNTGGSHPGPDMRVIEAYQANNTDNICFVQFDINSGKWGVDNFFGLTETSASYGAGSGRWMRVDWHFKLGSYASGGRTEARIWYDAFGAPNTFETITSLGDTGTTGTLALVRIGLTNIPADTRYVIVDDIILDDRNWVERRPHPTSRMGRVLSA